MPFVSGTHLLPGCDHAPLSKPPPQALSVGETGRAPPASTDLGQGNFCLSPGLVFIIVFEIKIKYIMKEEVLTYHLLELYWIEENVKIIGSCSTISYIELCKPMLLPKNNINWYFASYLASVFICHQDSKEYTTWKMFRVPNFLEVLEEFPSLEPSAAFLLSQLPLLKLCLYSISSSP